MKTENIDEMKIKSSSPNLFAYAARELHQDAVLAWLFDWSSPDRGDEDAQLHKTANKVFQALLARHPTFGKGEIECVQKVKTQWKSIDVFARVNLIDGRIITVVIENKTTSTRHDDQLKRYRNTVKEKYPQDVFIGLYIKTGWLHNEDIDTLPEGYVIIDRPILLEILRANPCTHAIYAEYVQYLEQVNAVYAEELAALDDTTNYSYALSHGHVQWCLCGRLFSQFSGENCKQYVGVNRDGSPWTQFRFKYVALKDNRTETLFWRFDQRKLRNVEKQVPYLAVRAYEWWEPKDNAVLKQEKLERLEHYRAAFDRAISEIDGIEIIAGKPLSDWSGKFESEVGVFLIDGQENTVPLLKKWIPIVHQRFLDLIA